MISICIPIYNYDVRLLVETLTKQIELLDVSCEIVLIDDCSSAEFRNVNEVVSAKSKYIQLPKNVGRSRIRNMFLAYAQFEFLLFLDCDSIIIDPNFVLNYIVELGVIEQNVICGGRIYPEKWTDENRILSWKYGVKCESQPFEIRKLNPTKSFMTNNFLIHRELLSRFKFDETLIGYGHEDTLFGYLLKINNIELIHINNPVLNGDIETTDAFLQKTNSGIENLYKIAVKLQFEDGFIRDVALLSFYFKIKRYHLLIPTRILFCCCKILIINQLKSKNPQLWLFKFYKFGVLSAYFKK